MRAHAGGCGTVGFERTTALDLESAGKSLLHRVLDSEVGRFKEMCNVSPWWIWKLGWPVSDTAAFADMGGGPRHALLRMQEGEPDLASLDQERPEERSQRCGVHGDGLAAHHPALHPAACLSASLTVLTPNASWCKVNQQA